MKPEDLIKFDFYNHSAPKCHDCEYQNVSDSLRRTNKCTHSDHQFEMDTVESMLQVCPRWRKKESK